MIGFEVKDGDVRQHIVLNPDEAGKCLSENEASLLMSLIEKVEAALEPGHAYLVIPSNAVYADRVNDIIRVHEGA